MRLNTFATSLWTTAGLVMAGSSAFAQEVNQELEIVGKPVNGAMGFQPAATELARDVHWLDNMLLVICTIITLFVTATTIKSSLYLRHSPITLR
jgi:cytochrome c oxidase subunit 2